MSRAMAPAAVPAFATEAPLAARLGLSDRQMALLGDLFAGAMRSCGIDGRAIFDRLAKGMPLAEALGVPPGVVRVLYARAYHLFNAGQHARAEAIFRSLCALDGRSSDHWLGFGICLRVREAFDEARLAFAVAAELRDRWAVPHFHLAELAMQLEAWPAARDELDLFGASIDHTTPAAMIVEAERLRSALDFRAAAPAAS
jgi:hypothetical protein